MPYLAHMKEALNNLLFAKLRSLLALLGILVGTASVVAMVLGGELAAHETLRQFKSLGTDLLTLSIHGEESNAISTSGHQQHLTLLQAQHLANSDSHIAMIAPYTQMYDPVFYKEKSISAIVLGVTDPFKTVLNLKLQSGRFVSVLDQYAPFCVIGHALYQKLKNETYKEPLGEQITIGHTIFIIVGVLAAWPQNSFVYADLDTAIFVPIQTSSMISHYAEINNIVMRLTQHAIPANIEAHISEMLNRELPNQLLTFRSAKALIAKMQNQRDILTVFLGLIGSVSLLVGGIGVMNIMLIAVNERRKEIGIRRAVGATRKDIAMLFLIEALMLALAGGLAGALLGVIIAYGLALWRHWQFIFFFWPIATGFSVSVAVGIFFGFYPAHLAAKLDPILALRAE